MQLSNGQNYRNQAYTLALPAVGVPFLAEIEEHWHKPCGRHGHDETQLLVMLSGAMRVWTDDHQITYRSGQACVIPPKLLHWVSAGDEADVRTVYVDVRLAPSCGPLHRMLNATDSLVVRSGVTTAIEQVAHSLTTAVGSPGVDQPARVMAILWQMAAELSDTALTSEPEDPDVDPRLLAAERYMKERLGQEIAVDDLAAASGLSRSQLSRLYLKVFHQSPAARLRKMRVEQAEYLLGHSTLSVKEVAHVCGFACANHFSRVYHELKGVPPTHGRRTA